MIRDSQTCPLTCNPGLICRPVMLVFVPQLCPALMSLFPLLERWKGYVAYNNTSTPCKTITSQSLKESNFSGKVKLMENIGGYNSVKGRLEFDRPLVQQIQQICLYQVNLGQFHACLSYHFGRKIYPPHIAALPKKARGQVASADTEVEYPQVWLYIG